LALQAAVETSIMFDDQTDRARRIYGRGLPSFSSVSRAAIPASLRTRFAKTASELVAIRRRDEEGDVSSTWSGDVIAKPEFDVTNFASANRPGLIC